MTAQNRASPILIVEDDPAVRMSLRIACEKEGFQVVEAVTGQDALAKIVHRKPQLVILDLMLPEMNGLDVCRWIRQRDAFLPVVMVTAKGEEIDKVVGLELGADDYITKPFSPRELVARLRAVLRRASTVQGERGAGSQPETAELDLRFGDLVIRSAQREVMVGGRLLNLTRTEYEILHYLALNAGRVLTRDQVVSQVWGYDSEGNTRLLDTHIGHLRAKIEVDPGHPRFVLTVRDVGYRLNPNP